MDDRELKNKHKRLLKELKSIKRSKKSKQLNTEVSEHNVAVEFELLAKQAELDDELSEFYLKYPQFNPEYERWANFDDHCHSWMKKESWSLYAAINLVNGYSPNRPPSLFNFKDEDLLETIRECAGVSLKPINPGETFDKYRFTPKEFATWWWNKTEGCSVPPPLTLLVNESLRNETYYDDPGVNMETDQNAHGNTIRNKEKREKCKKAIVKVIQDFPEECKSKQGKLMPSKIAQTVDLHWPNFTGGKEIEPPYSPKTIASIAAAYLKNLPSK